MSVPQDAPWPCKVMVNAKTTATTKNVEKITVTAWFTVPITAQTTGLVTVSVINLVLSTNAIRTVVIATKNVPKAAQQECKVIPHAKNHATSRNVDLTGVTASTGKTKVESPKLLENNKTC